MIRGAGIISAATPSDVVGQLSQTVVGVALNTVPSARLETVSYTHLTLPTSDLV